MNIKTKYNLNERVSVQIDVGIVMNGTIISLTARSVVNSENKSEIISHIGYCILLDENEYDMTLYELEESEIINKI